MGARSRSREARAAQVTRRARRVNRMQLDGPTLCRRARRPGVQTLHGLPSSLTAMSLVALACAPRKRCFVSKVKSLHELARALLPGRAAGVPTEGCGGKSGRAPFTVPVAGFHSFPFFGPFLPYNELSCLRLRWSALESKRSEGLRGAPAGPRSRTIGLHVARGLRPSRYVAFCGEDFRAAKVLRSERCAG